MQLVFSGDPVEGYETFVNLLVKVATCNLRTPELISHKSFWECDDMKSYLEALKAYVEQHPPNCGDGESVLEMLYECHNENNPYDNKQIKADFNELYQQMNGMPLREMDKIIYPVCKLCRDHEKAGFVEGIRIGIRLAHEQI